MGIHHRTGEHISGRNLQSGFRPLWDSTTSPVMLLLHHDPWLGKSKVALNDYEAAMKERASQFLSCTFLLLITTVESNLTQLFRR